MSVNKENIELNIVTFCLSLWEQKFKVFLVTLLFSTIGIIYISTKSQQYDYSIKIAEAKNSTFTQFPKLNNILEIKGYDYKLDTKNIYKLFVKEFEDYDEVKQALFENKNVRSNLTNLTYKDSDVYLSNIAKDITLSPRAAKYGVLQSKDHYLNLRWLNKNEGFLLADIILKKVLFNVKQALLKDLEKIISLIETENLEKENLLRKKIENLKKAITKEHLTYIDHLSSHADIARDLNITHKQTFKLKIDISEDLNFTYLKGYDVLDTEIAKLKEMSIEEIISSPRNTKKYELDRLILKTLELQNSKDITFMKDSFKNIKIDSPYNWVEYDLYVSDVKNVTNFYFYLFISIFIGIIFSMIFIMLNITIRNHQTK